jgi:hypothetical protein
MPRAPKQARHTGPLPITVHRNGALVDVIPEPMEVTGSGG